MSDYDQMLTDMVPVVERLAASEELRALAARTTRDDFHAALRLREYEAIIDEAIVAAADARDRALGRILSACDPSSPRHAALRALVECVMP